MSLFKSLILTRETQDLILAFVSQAFSPSPLRSILYVHGPSDQRRSLPGQTIAHMIDPQSNHLYNEDLLLPTTPSEFLDSVTNRVVIPYRNVHHIPDWLANSIYDVSTGVGNSSRKPVRIASTGGKAVSPSIILSSPTFSIIQPRLRRLCIIAKIPDPTTTKLNYKKIEANFKSIHSKALGALYKAVCTGLQNWDSVPRTFGYGPHDDLCRWVVALSPELGWSSDYFPALLSKHIPERAKESTL